MDSAFGPSSLPTVPVVDPTPPQVPASTADPISAPAEEASASTSSSNPAEDQWKAEYEALEASWKETSAKERAHAEATRKHWEEVRAKEAKERKERGETEDEDIPSGLDWVGVSGASSTIAASASPAPTDVRDLVAGEGQGGKTKNELEVSIDGLLLRFLTGIELSIKQAILPGSQSSPPESGSHDRDASEAESSKHEKWEEVSSEVTSSYPSLSFPSDPHSPSSQHHSQLHHSHHDSHHHPHHHSHHGHTEESGTTFAVFDSRLSGKTRALALFSSLAINLLLPFVNGVMLGFGEIFARNVVGGWFGWNTSRPGSVAVGVGLGRSRDKKH